MAAAKLVGIRHSCAGMRKTNFNVRTRSAFEFGIWFEVSPATRGGVHVSFEEVDLYVAKAGNFWSVY